MGIFSAYGFFLDKLVDSEYRRNRLERVTEFMLEDDEPTGK